MNVLTLGLALLVAQPTAVPLRRFALVAGANDGGGDRVLLRYAATDARAITSVLQELGGLSPQDAVILVEPSVGELSKAFDQLAARLEQAHASGAGRTEVVFYYSGHSDESGLLLKGEKLAYAALRGRLDALKADVRIAVLDSCASGALSRSKGGVARPSFLVDASSSLSGHAFLTSASEDESAQESESLKASIFTHFLVSGLRGAADASRDGKITLSEAYQYAFAETLARTTSTRSGPQRPSYDIALVGTGDLVLTDVRASSARLVLDASVGGRVYVLNASGGLVVEVAKAKGRPTELGLEPGQYRVVVDAGDRAVGEARVSLAKGQSLSVSGNGLAPTALETTVLRGGRPRAYSPIDFQLLYPLMSASAPLPRVGFHLGLLTSRVGVVEGVAVSSIGTIVDERVSGFAASGVFLKLGGLRGFAASGALLLNSGDSEGVQASLVNLSWGQLEGAQLALWNTAVGETTGAQLGLANVTVGPLWGVQAGLANLAVGPATGAQVGLVNIGGDVEGAQVGLLNIAGTVRGTQVGLLNIARESAAPIGLLNILANGSYKLAVWANETSVVNVGVRAGGKHVYSVLLAGMNPRANAGAVVGSFGAGVGVRAYFGSVYGELEGTFEQLTLSARGWQDVAYSTGLRLNIGYQLAPRVALFAGPQLHYMQARLATSRQYLSPWGFALSDRARLVPGVVAGIQFF